MCGRFILKSPLVELQRVFEFSERPNLRPSWNVAPTQTVPIVRLRREGLGREAAPTTAGIAVDATVAETALRLR